MGANPKFARTPERVNMAENLLEQIAHLASQADRHCFHHYGFDGVEPVDAELVVLAIDHLRGVIQQIGWVADLACKELTGSEQCRGDAVAWMLPPSMQAGGV